MHHLKIRPKRYEDPGFLHFPGFDAPAVVESQIHAKNWRAHTQSVSGHDRVAEVIHFDPHDCRLVERREIHRIDRVVVAEGVGALPGGAHIKKSDDLEIAPEVANYRLFKKILEYRDPKFGIHQREGVAVADILLEPTQVYSRSLVRKTFVGRQSNVFVEFWEYPIVYAAQNIEHFFRAK